MNTHTLQKILNRRSEFGRRGRIETVLLGLAPVLLVYLLTAGNARPSDWTERFSVGGDFRLRQESFFNDPGVDRHRQRFRLRVKSDVNLSPVTIGMRVASGTGEQVSTNQSFDNLASQKSIWIDRAYLGYKRGDWFGFTAGRMPNPLITADLSDLVWDGDVNPEGAAELFTVPVGESASLHFNLMQFALDEDSKLNEDQSLFSQELGAETKLGSSTLTLATALHAPANVTENDFGQNAQQEGNSRAVDVDTGKAGKSLASDFRILHVLADYRLDLAGRPLAVTGDWVRNLAENATDLPGEDTGFQVGLAYGKAKKRDTWEAALHYKVLEYNATLADLTDSDFGNGGTNWKGFMPAFAYSPVDFAKVKVKVFLVGRENEDIKKGDITRVQLDAEFKF